MTQTVPIGSFLDGDKVAEGTTVVVNFDSLGIEMVLAGDDVKGALGSYQDGDLDGAFQLASDSDAADRLEYDIKDMTIRAPVLNLPVLREHSQRLARGAGQDRYSHRQCFA